MIVPGSEPLAVRQAAERLRRGELVAFPTETVYGLGADAGNDAAVAKIFAAKGRPSDHPLIVHLARSEVDAAGVGGFAAEVPEFAHRLMKAFWPGPLTVILERRPGAATAAVGGPQNRSIGLRCPSHPVAQALLEAALELGVTGVAAPSANKFGRVSPTNAQHVQLEFEDGLLILDGGPCHVGIESAIVDCTRGVPVLLRPGSLTRERLAEACGQPVLLAEEFVAAAPRASGTLESHYAPHAKVRLMDARALQTALDVLGAHATGIATYSRAILHSRSPYVLRRRMPDDAGATAQQLFSVLRDFDSQGVSLIWVETPPHEPEWEGVRDRLERAAATV